MTKREQAPRATRCEVDSTRCAPSMREQREQRERDASGVCEDYEHGRCAPHPRER